MKDPNFSIAFSIGKFNIYWYAILLALGITVAMMITDRRAKKRALPKDIALDLCILGVPFGVLGGRLLACLSGELAWKYFFDLTRSGLSYFGGMLFAALAIAAYLKLRKVPAGEMLDAAAPGVFAGIGIAVWGDFFNHIHYGPLVEKSAHKWFPLATFGDDLKIHYAAFFYEFLLCVILIVLYFVLLRKLIRVPGRRFLLMAVLYCLGRFCIDSIRMDLYTVGPLAFDQYGEIVIAVLCLLLMAKKPSKSAATEAQPPESAESGEAETAEEKEAEAPSPEPKEADPASGLD